MTSPAKMRGCQWNCDPQNIAAPRKDCGTFVDEKLRALYVVENLTNKANIIIQYYLARYLFSTDYKIHDLRMTSNDHFTLNFHYYEPRFSN